MVCLDFNGDKDFEFNKIINNFIEDKIVLEGDYTPNSVDVIHYFRKEGMKKINELNKNYKNVFSRSWTLESHFLALDYKLQNPNVTWVAEFSDPLHSSGYIRCYQPYLPINRLICQTQMAAVHSVFVTDNHVSCRHICRQNGKQSL